MTRNKHVGGGVKSAIFACMLLGLGGCSYVSTFWEKEEVKAKGERIAVFPVRERLSADRGAAELAFSLPPEHALGAWPRSETFFRKRPDHISLPVTLKKIFSFDLEVDNSGDEGYVAPVIGVEHMYTLDAYGVLTARGGREFKKAVWRKRLPAGKGGAYRYGGMLLYKGILFVTSGGASVSAIRAGDGEILWTKNLSSVARAAPAAYGSLIFVNTLSNRTYALDIENGEVRWSHKAPQQVLTYAGTAAPSVYKDIVMVSYSSGDIFALDAPTGTPLWKKTTRSRFMSVGGRNDPEAGVSPQVYRGYAILSGRRGYISLNDLAAGISVWEKNIRLIREPWAAADYIYGIDSDLLLFALHAPDGAVRWTSNLAKALAKYSEETNPYFSLPVLAGGKIYIASNQGRLFAVNPSTGAIVTSYRIPWGVRHAPIASDGRLYIMSQDGELTVFGAR